MPTPINMPWLGKPYDPQAASESLTKQMATKQSMAESRQRVRESQAMLPGKVAAQNVTNLLKRQEAARDGLVRARMGADIAQAEASVVQTEANTRLINLRGVEQGQRNALAFDTYNATVATADANAATAAAAARKTETEAREREDYANQHTDKSTYEGVLHNYAADDSNTDPTQVPQIPGHLTGRAADEARAARKVAINAVRENLKRSAIGKADDITNNTVSSLISSMVLPKHLAPSWDTLSSIQKKAYLDAYNTKSATNKAAGYYDKETGKALSEYLKPPTYPTGLAARGFRAGSPAPAKPINPGITHSQAMGSFQARQRLNTYMVNYRQWQDDLLKHQGYANDLLKHQEIMSHITNDAVDPDTGLLDGESYDDYLKQNYADSSGLTLAQQQTRLGQTFSNAAQAQAHNRWQARVDDERERLIKDDGIDPDEAQEQAERWAGPPPSAGSGGRGGGGRGRSSSTHRPVPQKLKLLLRNFAFAKPAQAEVGYDIIGADLDWEGKPGESKLQQPEWRLRQLGFSPDADDIWRELIEDLKNNYGDDFDIKLEADGAPRMGLPASEGTAVPGRIYIDRNEREGTVRIFRADDSRKLKLIAEENL